MLSKVDRIKKEIANILQKKKILTNISNHNYLFLKKYTGFHIKFVHVDNHFLIRKLG